ncbi:MULTISPECIES: DUF6517 family protein [unclassified Haloferax]|uniref:DUF6517 family protein n=1 Tax=unclassified Haloferax TaxID=2625095 RepID=UPI0002B0B178|nr:MULTISPECIES: DUF6517 family protein [unclassified Haloferax]ELZ60084.1 hypothetical protein C460_04205 [Haloferax sp. ATCC BAA-646]ELZ64296.1 hypothetical protein C459_07195 [Haloferax sp. ATCC BAA-645]ELZ69868.1 hypothetical protein C458_06299 [Haloferax sp. ATCC BAA-644]
MPDALAPPTLPPLEGWVRVDDATDRPFELGPVSVVARTVVYEDAAIRERVPATADGPWRFLFASRLEIRPRAPPSKSLTKLVGKRASAGFRSRLEARGFSDVRRVESRTLRVRVGGGQRDDARDDDDRSNDAETEAEADVIRYAATVELAGVELAADAYLAVTPVDGEFLLTGGAYPREVRGGDAETAAALREAIDPERFREELFRVIRRVG